MLATIMRKRADDVLSRGRRAGGDGSGLPSEADAEPEEGRRPLRTGEAVARLLRLCWRYRVGCVKVLSIQLVLLGMGLLGLGLVGLGIDYLHSVIVPGTPAPVWPFGVAPPGDWSPIVVLEAIALGVLGLALVRSFLSGWYTIAMASLLQGQIVRDLRSELFEKMQRLSFRFFDANTTGSLINRITGDVQNVRLFVDGVVIQVIILTLSLAIYFAYMVSIHVWLTLACLATTPGIYLLTRRFSSVVQPAYLKERTLSDQLVVDITENIQGVHVVKGFSRERAEIAKFDAQLDALTEHKRWIFDRVSFYPPLIGLLTHVNLVILIAYGGVLVIRGELPLGGGMVVFAGLLQQFSGQVSNLANVANSMQQSLTGARRVFELMDTPIEVRSPSSPHALAPVRGRVEFRRVSFGYDKSEPVLRGIDLCVEAGQTAAILGATGSGKTTLLSLIPRFYDPDAGSILLDGVDVRELELDALRRQIGIVFQESFLFSSSIADNIAFGRRGATRAQIEQAAKIAAAHEFISALPQGYDTVLRESGSDLSGGQRQRLAIARAVLLDPRILLLDDPTAAIDANTEHEILDAMASAMQGRTTFVVAHRLSTLRRADLVVVLERGEVVQLGHHEELAAQEGLYGLAARIQTADDVPKDVLQMWGTMS